MIGLLCCVLYIYSELSVVIVNISWYGSVNFVIYIYRVIVLLRILIILVNERKFEYIFRDW